MNIRTIFFFLDLSLQKQPATSQSQLHYIRVNVVSLQQPDEERSSGKHAQRNASKRHKVLPQVVSATLKEHMQQ